MKKIIIVFSLATLCVFQAFSQAVIVDHYCTNISQIPESEIQTAKQTLHIAYGHTSHGSQLITGMDGLIPYMNANGYTNNLCTWNNGGTAGALDLHDGAMSGDVGYYPDWVNNTRSYLGVPDSFTGRGTGVNADVNVIIWSWCGQVSSQTETSMITNYLTPMSLLEADYPGIQFVYMTGHLDGSGPTGNLFLRNEQIRNYCIANNKTLYDFQDIESYDPDGLLNYMTLMANDNCDYDSDANGSLDKNWATEWQNSHAVNVDWYNCSPAHSQALNGNLKAYAAWWLWARLAGWNPATSVSDGKINSQIVSVFPNPADDVLNISINDPAQGKVMVDVFDLQGKNLISKQFSCNASFQESIDISSLAAGSYFIKTHNGNTDFSALINIVR